MPCVSGRESQSAGSLLQVDSPENVRTIYTDYTVYLHVLIKRLFLPDLVWSGSGWRCSSLETSATFCNSTSRLLYGVPAIPSPLPSTWRDPIQSNWISWDEMLHLTVFQIWQKNVATEWIWSLAFKCLAHIKHASLSNSLLIKNTGLSFII